MAVTERTRRVMTEGLVQALGEEVTDTLLAHLPPVGWGDVATQQDLAALKVELKAEMAALKAELKAEFQRELRMAISQQTRTLVWTQIGTILTVTVMAFGAARLI